jgi:hypothetical protein
MVRPYGVIFASIFACALTANGGTASAGQGKAKGHEKHAEQGEDDHGKKADDKDKGKKHDEHPVATSGATMRFHGLDKNNDGMITRPEWNGSNVSFANQDWNHDGILSGLEVRPGATRPASQPAPRPAKPPVNTGGQDPDDAIFRQLDTNHNGVLSQSEWNGTAERFNRIDFNHDGVLNPYEFGVGR